MTHSTAQSFTRSGRNNPCPVCGRTKDQDCSWRDGEVIFCHTHIDQDAHVPGYVYRGTKDGLWGQYFVENPQQQKKIRPKGVREFVYTDGAGKRIAKSVRTDQGDGTKKFSQKHWNKEWVLGMPPEVREIVRCYRYSECMEAKERGESIFVVEGEPLADLLWQLGIPATTTLGGCKAYRGEIKRDLEGASLIFAPDRDKPGIKYMEQIAQDFPESLLWCYAYPDSPIWDNLPEKGGLDLADYIEDYKLNNEGIINLIREKRHLRVVESNPTSSKGDDSTQSNRTSQPVDNVVNVIERSSISAVSLSDRIQEILSRNQGKADTEEALKHLAESSGWQPRDFEKLVKAVESDTEHAEAAIEAKETLPNHLRNYNRDLDPSRYLWGDGGRLALAIKVTAAAMPTAAAMIFSTFIPASASRIGTSSRIIVKASGKYVQVCIFWVLIVARSGKLKTPSQRIAIDPLIKLEVDAKEDYDEAMKDYDEAMENLQKGDEPPEKPVRKRYITKDSTLESLERIHSGSPRGLLYYRDEAVGMFKSQNAYKAGGKGADQEAELDQWNGSPLIVDREKREITLKKSSISRTGSIQDDVMQKLAGDHEDVNGLLARWLVCAVNAPPRYLEFDDAPDTGIDLLLEDLYRNLEKLPDQDYLIDKEAQRIFKPWQHQLVDAEIQENHPGLKLVYPKIEAYTLRLALWLHCVNAVLAGELPAPCISGFTMERAVELAAFFLGQAKLVYASNSPQSGLTGNQLKLLKFAEGKQKGITARQVKANNRHFREMSTTDICRELISLASDRYLHTSDKKTFFAPKSENVGVVDDLLSPLSTPEMPKEQGLQQFVVNVVNVDTSKNSTDSAVTGSQGFRPDVGDLDDDPWLLDDPPTIHQQPCQQCQQITEPIENTGVEVVDGGDNNLPTTSTTEEIDPDLQNPRDEVEATPAPGAADIVDNVATPIDAEVEPTPDPRVEGIKQLLIQCENEEQFRWLCENYSADDLKLAGSQIHLDQQRWDNMQRWDNAIKAEKSAPTAPTVITPDQELVDEKSSIEEDDSDPDDNPPDGGSPLPTNPSDPPDGGGESEVSLPANVEWLNPELPDYESHCQAISGASIVALDIETFQRDQPKKNARPKALHPWDSRIRLVQLCVGERIFLIDFGDRDRDFEVTLNRQQPTIELLRQVIQNPEQRIVGHNVHFDLRFLATKLGIRNAKNVVCTMVGAQVYYGDYGAPEGGTNKGKHEPILSGGYSLNNLAKRFLDITLDKTEQKSDFGADLTTEQLAYAARDPKVTLEVYQKLEALYADTTNPLYSKGLRDCWKLECDVIPCAIEIELAGLPLDVEAAKQQLETIEMHRQSLLENWAELCPDFKHTQRTKLLEHLNQEYQLCLSDLNKGSLDKRCRENPLLRLRLKLQGLDAQTNNLKGFLNSAARDNRVHTVYKTLTGFGRFSCGGGEPTLPNLQAVKSKSNPVLDAFNLPPVRSVIKPESGRIMAVIDLAGAHGRIAADQSKDETAIAGNNDPTIDNHSKVAVFIAKAQGLDWTADYIAKVRKDKNNPDHIKAGLFRDTAKNTYYGWLNGAGAKRIQDQITGNTGVKPEITDCEAAIEGCKNLYPKVL